MYTLRAPFAAGLYAEAGAGRIPRGHGLVREYVDRFGLELEPLDPSGLPRFLHLRGKTLPLPGAEMGDFPLTFTPVERNVGLSGLGAHYLADPVGELGDPRQPDWPPHSLAEYDRVTMAEFLRARRASAAAIALLGAGTTLMHRYSALELLMHIVLSSPPYLRIPGGMDLLPKAFAERLGGRIQYGRPVVRIEHDPDQVRAVTDRGDRYDSVHGDHLILALPFSVLRTIEIVPPFSPEKTRAIRTQNYERVTRVYLQSGSRFWLERGLSGFGRTDHEMEVWHTTAGQPGNRGILMLYLRGELAESVGSMPDRGRVRWGLGAGAEVFPDLPDHFQGGLSWSWAHDRWSRGAYAYAGPGDVMDLHPHLAVPEGRVHFAGEHTTVWPGWMEGALHSGLRAASEIAEA